MTLSRKKIIWLIALLVVVAGAWYGYSEFTRTNKDLGKVKADVKIPAIRLIREYESNDSLANIKYLGKIIETDGNIKDIEKDQTGYYTIILGPEEAKSSVRCLMDTTHNEDAATLTAGSSVVVRGACTGFKKNELLEENLGSDVELNRSVIISKK
jgi:hypothetical protein